MSEQSPQFNQLRAVDADGLRYQNKENGQFVPTAVAEVARETAQGALLDTVEELQSYGHEVDRKDYQKMADELGLDRDEYARWHQSVPGLQLLDKDKLDSDIQARNLNAEDVEAIQQREYHDARQAEYDAMFAGQKLPSDEAVAHKKRVREHNEKYNRETAEREARNQQRAAEKAAEKKLSEATDLQKMSMTELAGLLGEEKADFKTSKQEYIDKIKARQQEIASRPEDKPLRHVPENKPSESTLKTIEAMKRFNRGDLSTEKKSESGFAPPRAEDMIGRAYTDADGRLMSDNEQVADITRMAESGDMAGLFEKAGAYLDGAKMAAEGLLKAGKIDEAGAKKIIDEANDFIDHSFAIADESGNDRLLYLVNDLRVKNRSLTPEEETRYQQIASKRLETAMDKLMVNFAELAQLRSSGKLTEDQEKELTDLRSRILEVNQKLNVADGDLSDAELERQNLLMEMHLDELLENPETQADMAALVEQLNEAVKAGDVEAFAKLRTLILQDAKDRAAQLDDPEEAQKRIEQTEGMLRGAYLSMTQGDREVLPAMEKKPRSRARKLGYALVGLAAAAGAAFGIAKMVDNGGGNDRGSVPAEASVDTMPEDTAPTGTTVPEAETPASTTPENSEEESTATTQPESSDDDGAAEQDGSADEDEAADEDAPNEEQSDEDSDQDNSADETPAADESATADTPAERGDTQTPASPAEEPAAETEAQDVDMTEWSWNVAHQLAPGNENAFMQRGIDAYNAQNNTNFALTPHNGSTWIMDGNRAISPAEMEAMNQLMLADSTDTLPTTS